MKARFPLLAAISLAVTSSPLAANASRSALPSNACNPTKTLIAHGYGSPDDVALDGGRILFGDLHTNVLAAERNGKIATLVRGLSVPEGIVLQSGNRVVVVEQGKNRIDQINLKTRARHVLIKLRNATGKEGVDAIGPAPNGALYVPDSPYGTLYRLDRHNHLHLIASGMARPVDALKFGSGVAVADENDNAIWLVARGRPHLLATVPTPDDVAVIRGHLLAVTLGDGALWEVSPNLHKLLSGFGQPQGLARLTDNSVVVADSNANALYRVAVTGCL